MYLEIFEYILKHFLNNLILRFTLVLFAFVAVAVCGAVSRHHQRSSWSDCLNHLCRCRVCLSWLVFFFVTRYSTMSCCCFYRLCQSSLLVVTNKEMVWSGWLFYLCRCGLCPTRSRLHFRWSWHCLCPSWLSPSPPKVWQAISPLLLRNCPVWSRFRLARCCCCCFCCCCRWWWWYLCRS